MMIGRNQIVAGVVVVVLAVLIAVSLMWSTGGTNGRLDEVQRQVDAIRQAELDQMEIFGSYVSATEAPRRVEDLDPNPVPWTASEGFRVLSWAPDDDTSVHGVYSVVVTADDFRVTGRCDLDGDGVAAVFEATKDQSATRITPSGVK